ncbi:MAG: hypothetical protein WCH86_02300 [Kiritimatiellales bacterium]
MVDELNLEQAPGEGLAKTAEVIGEVSEAAAPVQVGGAVDKWGVTFNPEIHKAEGGQPIVGSKGQFLLKKEAKKSAGQRIKETFSKLWNGENTPETEFQPGSEIPPSDHELDKIQAENQEREISEQLKVAQKHADLTSSAENSADLYFFGLSMVLGVEALNQRNRLYAHTANCFYEYERKTGKSIDIPPGAALALGLGRIGWEVIQTEPKCKARFDAGAKVVRENAVKFIGKKLPFIRSAAQPVTEPGKDA